MLWFRGTRLLWFHGAGCWHYAVQQVGRVKRIDDEVGFRRAAWLSRKFKMERALADVRAFGGSGYAIGSAGVDVAVVAGRFDVEVPGRAEEFESLHGARIPVGGVGERNLSVADQHGDVVGPGGRGTGNFCGFGGYVRRWNAV